MPSSRLPGDFTPNAATRALAELGHRGVAVADLTLANPTRAGLDYPPHLLSPLASPAGLAYAPEPLGLRSAREAVVEDFSRRGLHVAADEVVLTASTSEAYAWLFKLLCDPGDVVLVPRPSYPLFDHLTALESVVARPYRLEWHGTWRMDIDQIARAIDDRTRAVLVVSPNNPTGSWLHRDDLAALETLCAARGVMIVGDEVFADYPLDPAPWRADVITAPGAVTCSLGGLSKSVGLPQVKLGWIAFAGPPPSVRPLLQAMELIADTYLSVSTPTQLALPALLREGVAIREQIATRVARNLHALRAAARTSPEVSVLPVEGGWSAVIQVPSYRSEENLVVELLTRDHVLVHPGYFFDFEREAFLVLSLLPEPQVFEPAVRRVLARATTRDGRS